MEPDFKALARVWMERDPRMKDLKNDRREALVDRLAEALARRRASEQQDASDIGLVVKVDRGHIEDDGRLSSEALKQLSEFVQERIDS